jgi:tetratricopeptide (TPR) repeat protein
MKLLSSVLAVALALLGGGPQTAWAGSPSAKDRQFVAAVAKRLLAQMKPVEGFDWQPDVKVVDSDRMPAGLKLNAWANAYRAGGKLKPYVRVTDLWLKKVVQGDPDILALTLAHELGHIYHRHVAVSNPGSTDFLRVAIQRKRESEADAFGARLMKKAGFSLIHGVLGLARIKGLTLHNAPLDALRSDHPAWDDRFGRVVQNPRIWEALATFDNGVALLSAEQFFPAERCFQQVTKFDPYCYEAWVNLGHTRLMRYCDQLSTDDLKDMGIGQVLCGAFYRRAQSLEPGAPPFTRGKDSRLWSAAVGALRQALKRKPDLALAKANLGLAYLVDPDGKEVAKALKLLRQAQAAVAQDKTLTDLDRAALQTNLSVALLAGGQRADGLKQLAAAQALLQKLNWWDMTLPSSAIRYNEALALAEAPNRQDRDRAVKLFEEYLRQSDSYSAWWPIAYEHYAALCKDLKEETLDRTALQKRFNTRLRMQTTLTLQGGLTVTLAEKTADVLKRLGKHTAEPLVGNSLKRYRFAKYAIELLAGNRVIAIILRSKKSPALTLRPLALGAGKAVRLRVGMSRKELLATLPGARAVVGRNLLKAGDDDLYSYYRQLGLAVRYDADYPNGNVTELILVQTPEPPG